MHNKQIVQAYRELLKLTQRITPKKQSIDALEQAKSTIRQHMHETDPIKQQDLHKQLYARISFLRTIVPRRPGDQSSIATGHYVLREGKLVPGAGQSGGSRVADGTISMSEARQKHQQLLQRQHFGRKPATYNPSSF